MQSPEKWVACEVNCLHSKLALGPYSLFNALNALINLQLKTNFGVLNSFDTIIIIQQNGSSNLI